MKKISKFIITLFLILSTLGSHAQYNDCPVLLLSNDLSASNPEFRTLVKQPNGFKAWQLLNNEAPTLRTNLEELKLVSNNLEEIKKADGYLKWKALGNTAGDVKLLGSSKISNISGLTATENSIIYTEANKLIDEVALLANKKKPGAGCILVNDVKFQSALSDKTGLATGELPDGLHPLVESWFKNPNVASSSELISRATHGKCAEPKAVSQWLFEFEKQTKVKISTMSDAKDALKGSKMVAFETTEKVFKGDVVAEIGNIKPACKSCNPFLESFGIEEIFVETTIHIK